MHASNNRLEHDVQKLREASCSYCDNQLAAATAEVVSAVHSYGGIVLHDVINLRHAQKAAEQGVDGIIAVCTGAGGHAGLLSPFALVKQIREVYSGAIILSGAMSTGADVLAAQALGADLAYMGTRFIATTEANASEAYKNMLVDSSAEDIVYTKLVHRDLRQLLARQYRCHSGLDPSNLPAADKTKMDFGSGGNTDAPRPGKIFGVQAKASAEYTRVETTAALVDRMEREYQDARVRVRCG